jgi:hypothetical protein
MNKRQVFLALILLFALLTGSIASVHALPPMPATFYGTVLINGVNAPVGTGIAARSNGVEYASTTVVDTGGNSMYAIDVPGEDPDIPGIQGGIPGDTIVFLIGGHPANQTGTWQEGMLELNLSYSPNNLPTAANNAVTILEDAQKTFAAGDFNFSDTDPGDALSQVQITALEEAGALYLDANSNGSIDSGEDATLNQVIPAADIVKLKFRPAANANGSPYASFGFKVHDGEDYSLEAYQMTVHVTPVNDAPSFTKGANQTVDEDAGAQSVPGWATNISAGPADESGQVLAFNITGNTNPALFSVLPAVGASTGALTYTPAANANGAATITIRLADDGGTANGGVDTSPAQNFTVTVNPINDPPAANAQSVTTPEDTAKSITLTGSDVETASLGYVVVGLPSHGALSGTAPSLTYTPASNYSGPDSFTFKVNDGTVDSPTAQVSITVTAVNDPPVANPQAVTTPEDTAKSITLTGSDVESVSLVFTVVAQPSHGALSGTAPNLTYTPASNYSGSDSFTFKVNDGTVDSSTAQVSITVTAVNDPPAANPQSVTTPEDTAKSITLTGSDVETVSLVFTVVAQPSHGALSGTAPNLTYTPASNYSGPDSFTFKVNDGTVDSPTVQVSITVTAVNDPPAANPQAVTTPEDTAKSITLTGSDVETMSLIFTIVAQPSHGALSGTAPNLTYTPASNYSGPDSFTFKVNDGTVDSPTAQVSITVTTVNDVPVCQDLALLTTTNLPAQVAPSCTDIEGEPLTYSIATQPAHGTASVAAGMLEYAPAAGYTGTDSFTYRANDGLADSNTATVSAAVLAPYPTVLSISRMDPTPTDRLKVRFTVTFSSIVTGVTLDDFAAAASGVTGAVPSALAGSGNSYTVTVNTGTGDGTLGLNLVDNNSILDPLSHPLGGPGLGDGNFTGVLYKVDKTNIYTSQSTYDGWVLESTETSGAGGTLNTSLTVFNLGDDALDRQYRAVLSFNTATLPDTAVITKITLRINKQGLVGTNPFATHGNVLVDIRKGAFSGNAALQTVDFQASASRNGIGTIKNLPSGNWYQANLLSTAFSSVDKLGLTQLRLRFTKDDNDDRGADFLKFYSGNAGASFRPQLIIQYYVP